MQELSERARSLEITAHEAPATSWDITEPEPEPGDSTATGATGTVPEHPATTKPEAPAASPPAPAAPELAGLARQARADRATEFIEADLVPRLRRELSSQNPNARISALNGLAQLGDAGLAALPDIWKLANDPRMVEGTWGTLREQALAVATHMAIRAQSIRALIGLPTAADLTEVLEEGLRDEDPDVRLAAVQLAQDQARRETH